LERLLAKGSSGKDVLIGTFASKGFKW